jgi:hypothetical protein
MIRTILPTIDGITDDATLWIHHDSTIEFAKQAERTDIQNPNADLREQIYGDHRPDWFGLPSINAVRAAVTEGWPDGVARVRAAFGQLVAPRPRSIRRRIVRADFGNEFDIHSALRGRLDTAWTLPKRQQTNASANVTLVSSIAANADIASVAMFWRGAGVVTVADALTAAGYNVQIIAIEAATDCYPGCKIKNRADSWILKSFQAPLDLPAIASGLCLSGMLRYYAFMARLNEPMRGRQGLGRAVYKPFLPLQQFAPAALFAPERMFSQSAAQEWIDATLASFGTDSV